MHGTGWNKKAFSIVGFLEDDGMIEVIPSVWIVNKTEAKWPNISSIKLVTKLIRERRMPREDWAKVKIKIYATSNSFRKAKMIARIAQETSNIDSDSSDDNRVKRKRRAPTQFEDYLSTSEDEDVEEITYRPRKRRPETSITISDAFTLSENSSSIISPRMAQGSFTSSRESSSIASPHTVQNSSRNLVMKKEPLEETPATSFAPFIVSLDSNSTASSEKPYGSYINNMPTEEAFEEMPSSNLMQRIFAHLKLLNDGLNEVKKDLKDLKREIIFGQNSVVNNHIVEAPSGLPQFPITTEEDLKMLNEQLSANNELSTSLVRFLRNIGSGKNPKAFVRSVTRKLLSRDVALLYSRYGRKGKKDFSEFHETLNVIIAATAMAFPTKEREELSDMFGRALASAADWEGRRKVDT